jgi:CheY-like chemotaxis protein
MKRILVVDDDPAIGRLAKVSLESTGAYGVYTETMGARAVETARECRPDLILLDIMMPDMDGAEVAAALHEDLELKHIKVVFLTALLRKGEETVSGKHKVMAKPVTARELVAIIEQELGQQSQA